MMEKPSYGVYSGSFDPIHRGHQRLVKKAVECLGLERLFVIPSACSPFKLHRQPTFSYTSRFYAVSDALSDIPRVFVVGLEENPATYSIDTLRLLHTLYPQRQWSFIMGSDSIKGFAKWKNASEIVNLTNLVLVKRPGITMDLTLSLRYLPHEANPKLDEGNQRIVFNGGHTLRLIDLNLPDVSSAHIKAAKSFCDVPAKARATLSKSANWLS